MELINLGDYSPKKIDNQCPYYSPIHRVVNNEKNVNGPEAPPQ